MLRLALLCYDIVLLNVHVFVLPTVSHLLADQPSLMIAFLVMVTVFSRITIISAKPCGDGLDYNLCAIYSAFHEDEMSPDISEQISVHLHENDSKKRTGYDLPARKNEAKDMPEESGKNVNVTMREEVEDDVVREDHITQHQDVMVNTDSEITGLQVSEVEDGREFYGNKDDSSVSSLTEHEEALLEENYLNYIENNILDNNDIPE